MGKESARTAGGTGDAGSIPGLGRSPGEGHGSPLQYSCLENPIDRGASWAPVLKVTKSQTQMEQLSVHAHPLGSEQAMGALKKVDVVFVF